MHKVGLFFADATRSASLRAVGLNWQVQGFGTFGSVGGSGLRDVSTGGLQVYNIRNNQITSSTIVGTVGLEWQFCGIGNFGGRGASDMMLRNSNTGRLQVYNISNNQITGSAFIGTVGLDWQFSGIGNFGSVLGQSDLLLRNISTGALQVYNIINNNQLTGSASLNAVGSDWQFRGRRPGQRSRNERRPAAVIAISPRWRTARRKVSPASVGNRPSEPRT